MNVNETSTPPVPPLPHLTGPVPVAPTVRRGRVAFWLSAISWALFFAGFAVFIYVAASESKNAPWVSPAETVGVILFLISPLFSLSGLITGIKTRSRRAGKAALIVGAANLITWAALVAAGVWMESRKH